MTTWLTIPQSQFRSLSRADLLFRDLFSDDLFSDILDKPEIKYPIDIKETADYLELDIAAVDLDKNEIEIEIKDGNVISISHKKKKEEEKDEACNYYCRGITRKSFDFEYKISSKFNVNELDAKLDKGLLRIKIPTAPEKKPKLIEVK